METHKPNSKRRRFNTITSTCKTIALLCALVLASSENGRPQTPAPTPAQDADRLRNQIQKGKPEAIVEAGDTHNPIFINDLKALHKSSEAKEPDVPRLIRISLAKLGDKDALQETYCRVQSSYPLVKQSTIENDLMSVGGWFSIQLLERQFHEDERWRKAPRKYWNSVAPDMVLVPPSNLALMVLPKLVKDPPLSSPIPLMAQTSPQQEKIDTWKRWIQTNSRTLRNLQPTGQDLDTSSHSCDSYRSQEKEWLKGITN